MFAQRQKPIDFAAEGLRLALFVDRNCGIRVEIKKASSLYQSTPNRLEKIRYCCEEFRLTLHPVEFHLLPLRTRRSSLRFP